MPTLKLQGLLTGVAMCSVIPERNRIVSSWSLYSGSSSTLFPRGRGQVAGGLFPLVSLLFLLFVLLPVEGLFCCPSVEQGLITKSTSAPAQISIEIRPLPLPLCPTPAGGSWGMRNAELRSPHSLWNCLKCYLAPMVTSHGSDSCRLLGVWTSCQATAVGCVCVCVCVCAQTEATGSFQTLWTGP